MILSSYLPKTRSFTNYGFKDMTGSILQNN